MFTPGGQIRKDITKMIGLKHYESLVYLQIADSISEDILLRKWSELERIPSVREMAVTLEVNPNTVQRTYTFLQSKGIIFNRRGIGYFVQKGGRELT